MPIIRYQIRNEYGLADPELYGAADKEDPEALLEGVAMAGLVGVLRQLGDLAEFAAEIFHDLHEEVMATASRGHALMLRVQQLEVDFPAIEKDFLSQTGHSQFSYSAGIDWHPNLQIDQNLVTREDMPRFILDSYEESRGPPRLFVLDKFDIAGDGACLKRYSDPSFFKRDFASYGKMEPDIQREKRSRKNKKKVPRWKNGETPESYMLPHMNSKLEHVASEKALENPPVKRVKLKTRQLNDNTSIRRSYVEHVVGKQPSEHTYLSENSISNSQVKMKTSDSTELSPEVHEVIMDTSIDRPFSTERNRTKPYNKEEVNLTQREERISDIRDDRILKNEKRGLLQEATGEAEKLPPTFNKATQKDLLFDADCKREGNMDAENRTSGSLDGYKSDDAVSELDTYLDALTTMDSEIETDNERAKPNLNVFSKDYNKIDSSVNEERDLLAVSLDSHVFRESSTQNSLSNQRMSSPPIGDSLNSFADSIPSYGTSRAPIGMFIDPETPGDETHDINFENNKANCELLGKESSIDLVPKQITLDIPSTLSESGVESSSSCIEDTSAALMFSSLHASPEDIQSATPNQTISSDGMDSTEKIGVHYDGQCSPPANSEVHGAAEDANVTMSNLVEGQEEIGKHLEDDSHQRSDESKIPSMTEDDYFNPCLVSENTEFFSDALLNLGDESGLNLQIQDDPFLVTQRGVLCTEESSAESTMSMPGVSDTPQVIKAANLETASSICVEDLSLPLSKTNKEELHGSVSQDPNVNLGESTLPGKCPPIFPLDNSSSTFVPNGLFGPVDTSVISDEKSECARSLTNPEGAAHFADNEAISHENTGNSAENEVIASGMSLSGPALDIKGAQESSNLNQVELTQKGELPNIVKVLPNVSDHETGDSSFPTGDLNLMDMAPSCPPMESPPAESCSPHPVTECTEAELCSALMHSESSLNGINLQEDQFSCDSVSEQQHLQVSEASSVKDLMNLDVQLPCSAASQEEYVVTGPQDSESAGFILDQPDCGEHSHVCHTEPFELEQDGFYPSDGDNAVTSFVEVEGGKLLNPILQNESDSISSDIEHNLGNIEASNSEDLTGADNHQVSKIAFSGQEKYDAVGDPGDSKSAEIIHDSFDCVDLKPVICAPRQEDQKIALFPQNLRTEERLIESSDTSDIESVKHAEVNMHPFKVNKVIVYPLETQEVPHSEPLSSSELSQVANGDIFLSNDAITETTSPLKEVYTVQSSNEFDEISLQQEFGSLNLSDIRFEREQSCEVVDDSIKRDGQASVPAAVPDSVEPLSSGKICESDISSVNISSFNLLHTEVDSPLQSSLGISVTSAISSASPASLQTSPCLGASNTAMIKQPSELSLDEDPPLPPLPPLQWRMGRLRPSFVMSNGDITRPKSGPNYLTALPSLDHSGGPLLMNGAAVHPSNPFLQVQLQPNDSDQFSHQTLGRESINPFQSSALPSVVEDEKCQDDMLGLTAQMEHVPTNSSSIASHVEDDWQKSEFCQEALSGEVPQSSNPLTSPLSLSEERSQYFPPVSKGESIEPPECSASQPILMESQHRTASRETATMHPSNPFTSSTSTEVEICQYEYEAFEGTMVQRLEGPDRLSTAELAPQDFLIFQGAGMQSFEITALSAAEHEKPNGRLRSILNRPRDPLIEAVASHDKSTLRRVSELVRPSARPEGERNTLLDQIRTKSFNLKPATVAKPNIKGPPTNLKVAAILEKANAIRQACVGSDEDDDGDSWSDS